MPFTISAKPGTDIWRKPPGTDIFNAPSTTPQTAPLPTFKSARLTFSAPWKYQYDQAGLLFTFHPSSTSSTSSSSTTPPPRWIKTGLEYYFSTPNLSTVSCTTSADWSLTPLPPPSSSSSTANTSSEQKEITILARKEGDIHGTSLWIYYVNKEEKLVPLREICWVFENGGKGWDISVSGFAARPEKEMEKEGEVLEVLFGEDVVVEWE